MMGKKAEAVAWNKLLVASSNGRRGTILASQVETDEFCYRSEAVARLRSWERYGWGKVKLGRRGWDTRFIVAKATTQALRKQITVAAVADPPMAASASTDAGPAVAPATTLNNKLSCLAQHMDHPFQLREDLAVKLSLPVDLTEREAGRLARFIETLPL
jgi:hypothetical protein